MKNLTFDALNQAWNRLRTSGAETIAARVPMLQTPRVLMMQRVAEDPFEVTVMFRGFEKALTDTERGTPLMKRFLFDWTRNFGEARIQRGDDSSMIIQISKPSRFAEPTAKPDTAHPQRDGALANIAQVRNVNGYQA